MPAAVPGFEHDIFISYRHNDNRSGWVTEFLKSLEEELASTIKEPVSVYFDANPHDGLLETHSVDKSLEGKLKCLIFIPIISQTYCDPKSFAWQNEFCAFNKRAKEDRFGRDIKLSNGNVANRILPVRIHDLDVGDTKLLTHELGGALRAIEFIYRSSGVNRPLLSADNPDKNINKTIYRDQINKIANGVMEIISALKNFDSPISSPIPEPALPRVKVDVRKILKITSLALLFALFSGYIVLNFVGIINLSNSEQQPMHKLILPFFILAVLAIVIRQPYRKMGQSILQIVAVVVIGGGVMDIVYTFTSTTVPDPYVRFLEMKGENVSDKLVRLEFALLRSLGSALIAAGIGAWFLLRGRLTREREMSVVGVVLMFSITESTNAWELYALDSPFYIYSIAFFLMTWIGAALWWKGSASETLG